MSFIPKIELKITSEQLTHTCNAIDFENPQITFENREKVEKMKSYYSLLDVVRLKLAKKLLSSSHKTKPFKLSLEFYEANCLHKTLMVVNLSPDAQNLFNQLDQKLA